MSSAVVQDKYDKGCYYVDGQTWQVGTRYTLLKQLGSGSFSSVVAALDNDTGEKVALKRIPDVLNNAENAKRVLREVCILRRLSHPHIISLRDVFLKPSSTGRYVYKGGKLVPTSLDLYLALEYCDQGDLFHMRGQLSEPEVKVILLQLISAVKYLHRNGVWHRDVKSANILMTYTGGQRFIKLADLGSARSVLLEKRLRGGDGHHHQHSSSHQQQHQQNPLTARCSFDGSIMQQQGDAGQQGMEGISLGTQTTGSLEGTLPAGADAQQQRGTACGAAAHAWGEGSAHSQHDSMDTVGSGDNSNQQQQQQQGSGSCLDPQQQRRAGSIGGSRTVTFDAPAGSQQQNKSRRLAPIGPPVHHSDSFLADGSHSSPSDIYARPVAGGGGGFKAPLTRMVCTPCYRAPEVVMSRGGYTEQIDMWGCGCVFGELLQRVAWIGKATTPQLQVAPVFAIHGVPQTPTSGERFDGPGNSITRSELAALFAVIGTPSWRCIESVANPAWRRYLRKVPGRAPTLFRRFGSAGEVAVDLLARLLSFDPVRRCSSEEAISHEYFGDIRKEASSSTGNLAALLRLSSSGELAALDQEVAAAGAAVCLPVGGAAAGGLEHQVSQALEAELDRQQHQDEEMDDWEAFRMDSDSAQQQLAHVLQSKQQQQCSSVLKRPREQSLSRPSLDVADPFTVAAAAGGDAMDEDAQQHPAAAALPPLPPPKPAGGSSSGARQQHAPQADSALVDPQSSFRVTPSGQHYYELDDPAAALAALEHDMAALMTDLAAEEDSAPGGPPPQAPQLLRELLEREVGEHSSHLEKRRQELAATSAQQGAGMTPSPPGSPLLAPVMKRGTPGQTNSIRNQWQHLQPDPGPTTDASRIAYQRMPHHADAEQAHLDPQQHLKEGRHGEWMAETLQAPGASRTCTGNVWGVSLVPTGYTEEAHPELAAIIRHQNKR